MLELCERLDIDVLIPTVDSELIPIARRKAEFEALGTRLLMASRETLEVCLDKWALHERCCGSVRVPATSLVDSDFDPTSISLPAIIKPRTGSGSRGFRPVTGAVDIDPLERDGTLLVQELLPGPEFSLDVLADSSGDIYAVVPRERLKVDSGIAITGRTTHDPELERFGIDVARLIGLTTVANIQVKYAATMAGWNNTSKNYDGQLEGFKRIDHARQENKLFRFLNITTDNAFIDHPIPIKEQGPCLVYFHQI